MTPDVAAIAAGLSEAQRRAILQPEPWLASKLTRRFLPRGSERLHRSSVLAPHPSRPRHPRPPAWERREVSAALSGRCGKCMQPFSDHISRREARPICRSGGVYREATEEELDAGYKAAFPDGPKPIATFRADCPVDLERA
jgi:hypothetical protein